MACPHVADRCFHQLGDLVFLLTRVNDEFPGNHVVRICNFEQQPQSATAVSYSSLLRLTERPTDPHLAAGARQ